MKILWANNVIDAYGNSLGYASHNKKMIEHIEKYVEFSDDAKIAVHITSAEFFKPIPNKINVLFTMWEYLDVPDIYIKALQKADYVIVPSSFCRDIFKPYCKNVPLVCWEGIEPKDYPYKQRTVKDKFRFLWLGASNARKGYHTVIQLARLCNTFPKMEVYMKTTMPILTIAETIKTVKKEWRNIFFDEKKFAGFMRSLRRIPHKWNANKIFTYGKNNNIIVDTRKIPVEELRELYYTANVFLSPSLGEGWGLPLGEAMATGCPCLATADTGTKDFFDDKVGYVVKTEIYKNDMDNYGIKDVRMFMPDAKDFIQQALHIATNYEEALKKAKKASDRMHSKFTWELSGKRLFNILKEIEKCS